MNKKLTIENFHKHPSRYAKSSCNRCYGRGVEGHRLVTTRVKVQGTAKQGFEPVMERRVTRHAVYCSCAVRRFQRAVEAQLLAEARKELDAQEAAK